MRSHAKASSVGSNQGGGESRRSFRLSGALATLLVALVASACLLPGTASAIEFRSLTGSFGPDGGPSSSFSELLGPLAFDQGNKRLYALDGEAQAIYGYDASSPGTHTPLGGSFPLSAPGAGYENDIAVDSSSHDLYFANGSGKKAYGFDENGAGLSGFPITHAGGESFSGPICGAAVDPAGHLWLGERSGFVYEFAGGTFTPYVIGSTHCRMAFDSEGNLFFASPFGPVTEYTAASGYLQSSAKVIDSGFSYGLTVDRSTNEIYVVHYSSISVYDDSGAFLYEFGESVPGAEYYGELGGIAIDEASEEVYVSDYGNRKIDVFGPPLSLPKLTTEGASGVSATEATVNGTINPRGQAVEDCHFEVVPASQFIAHEVIEGGEKLIRKGYEQVTPAEKYPCVPAAGSIPADANPHAVSAEVTGLNPATVYHYRLVAKNSIGEAHGIDRQLTTGPTAPLVEEESVKAVGTEAGGTGEATLTAEINPRGGETTYHLEYGTTSAYGQSTEESAPFGFPTDASKHAVSVHIGGLEPGTAYHFRFVAGNEAGPTDGADATFATYPTAQPFAPCPSGQFRTGAGSRLPDCRAYEQGTPVDKHGANAQGEIGVVNASPSGDRFTFYANGGLPTTGGSSGTYPFLASRGPGGWSADGLLPVTEPSFAAGILGVDEDLSAALILSEGPGGAGEQLFLRNSETATFEPGPVLPSSSFPEFIGFAADPGHVVFAARSQLLPGAPAEKPNLYDLDHGALTLADRVPAGSEVSCDDEAGPACEVPAEGSRLGKVASNGSVFFTVTEPGEPEGTGRIYVREDGVRTTWISASQRTVPDPGGEKPAKLLGITPDGSKAFFLSCEKLTDGSTAVSTGENRCSPEGGEPKQGQDLYSYDVATGELTDLTADSNAGDPLGAAVQLFLGASEDGSYVYFTAEGALAPGASHPECWRFRDECNLYVSHDGVTKFIARLIHAEGLEPKVSADGRTFVFRSAESLTGYDNIGSCDNGGAIAPCNEFFRYSAPEEELLCVTCLPTGTPPSGGAMSGASVTGFFLRGSGRRGGVPRNLSADGNRFFFNTVDAMVPGDTNHATDVYEWEAKGEGSCESESQDGGCIYLISSGTDPAGAAFLDASRNGDHAFFFTEQQLVPTDQDHLFDVYDAGVGAGLASQHTLAPPSCSSTACQANPAPPPDPSLASAAYSGAGNVHGAAKGRKCPKGKRKVRSGGKVSCQRARKQHKRHDNRGGSK